jgi:hypothetical protein
VTIREGKWKCPGCGEVNRGSDEKCASCGATRDANTKFFFDENDAPVVTDAGEIAKAKAGPDWVCSFCDNSNPAGAPVCEGCGAPPQGKVHASGAIVPVGTGTGTGTGSGSGTGTGTGIARKLGLFGLLFVLLSCLCCMALFWAGRPHEGVATVASVEWRRWVDVEAMKPVEESEWDSAPEGARDITHHREVRDHKQVQRGTKTVTTHEKVQVGSHKEVVGHKDLGNGRFEDVEKDVADYDWRDVTHEEPAYVDEPVYGEKYTYKIDRWKITRTPDASGTAQPARWPDVTVSPQEREGGRHELYKVWFKIPGEEKPLAYLPTAQEFENSTFEPGDEFSVTWGSSGILKLRGRLHK